MVRVAIAGLGFMGKMHMGVYGSLPDSEVTAVCDLQADTIDLSALEPAGNIKTTTASKQDLSRVRSYTDYGKMLRDGGFDVVDICLPTKLHPSFAQQAFDSGYHVFCEKPIALTEEDSAAMIAAAARSGRLLGVGQCLRFWPAYSEVRKLLQTGPYGRVKYAEFARFSSPPGWGWKNWLVDGAISGNAGFDLHIHDVDMVLYLFGPPSAVSSRGVPADDGSFQHIATLYDYPDKVVASTGGWICTDSFGFNMRAFFILERATIELDFSKEPNVSISPQGGARYALPLPSGDGYYHELADFVAGVARGRLSGVVTGESAAESVRVCLREIESAGSGLKVPI
ncbi:MAG TPA: Gfo/Idh/MocA family oxidoreductase [Spirochaetia bacterium]|nr:Gfo/Idh/MocA family oxidoreductase [Spirochaetia bacterium]